MSMACKGSLPNEERWLRYPQPIAFSLFFPLEGDVAWAWLLTLVCMALWLAYQWRRSLFMIRVRDKALSAKEQEIHRLKMDNQSLWHDYERTRLELKEQKIALERTTHMMRLVLDTIPVRVYWKDRELMYLGGNRIFLQDAQMTAEELSGKYDDDMPWRSRAEHHRKDDMSVIERLTPKLDFEEPFTTAEGRKLWLRVSKIPMRDATGKVVGLLGTYEDITRRRRTEAAYRESKRNLAQAKEMLQLVLDNIPARVYWKDNHLRYLGGNRLFLEDAGFHRMLDLIGKTDKEMIWSEEAGRYHQDDRWVIDHQQPNLDFEEPQITPVGIRWIKKNRVPLKDGRNQVMGVLGTYEDITERKKTEEELFQLRQLLAGIIDAMPSIIVGVDSMGRVNQWNQEAAESTGLHADKVLGQALESVFPWPKDALDALMEAIKTGNTQRGELLKPVDGGASRILEWAVYPLAKSGVEGAVVRLDDITERTRMEEVMIQTEKMMSVGGLAAGMAHEINNPLAGIVQNAQVMANRFSADLQKNHKVAKECKVSLEEVNRYLDARGIPPMILAILESGRRAAQIVANMLSFSRKAGEQFEHHNILTLMEKTIDLASNDYDLKLKFDFRQIQIQREYQTSLPPVPCEASKIQQVFFNILKNGAQAMAAWTAPEGWNPSFLIRIFAKKGYVIVEIEDNGPGMNKHVRKRIFEPFFTTKGVGIGTGLGLSVSYFIITENHRGKLGVVSASGAGTRFTIELPLAKEPPEKTPPVAGL